MNFSRLSVILRNSSNVSTIRSPKIQTSLLHVGIPRESQNVTKNNTYQIALDKHTLKTPAGAPLITSNKHLAALIAGEWESQKTLLKQHSLPLTSLVARSIDTFEKNPSERQEVITRLLRYLDTDTVCYQEIYPDILVILQRQYWDPIVDWVKKCYGVDIKITNNIIGIQPPETKDRLKAVVERFDDLKLSAFERATMISKSFLIGLGLVERKLTVEEAFKASQVEIISQTMHWGEIEDGCIKRDSLLTPHSETK
ncbi:16599_t:CDS:2 [Acaulospora morrowiae]|uniref:16599_t:CDS:1 n=1 Tax=Acaulospora morrowiae TaxID=94023 RepID=A0A9N8VFE1_9GLOM|nr:16599_t:CDS:2 [Acaulospora morrowiae]